ncbi:hypothetical protein BXZ70DRAFT_18996 [Cristinia sonorae]|uniref:Uncharacterized protein n=1 Tax=Cristinia sonorae TaxID=1940300 RepID=A0A8K0UXW6_9AGAR|nr:hypothetical protein BXZ70DRAFT_18996 [Cristinia sonorae]
MADPVPTTERNSFLLTIDDTSPTVIYSPFAGSFAPPDLSTGWTPSSIRGIVQNLTLHATAVDDALVRLRWNGTGISFFGDFLPQSDEASFSVTLDGTPTTNFGFFAANNVSENVLASFANLTYGEHDVELALHKPDDNPAVLRFDRAVIVGGIPSLATKAGNSSLNSPVLTTEPVPDDAVSFQGQWSFQPELLPGQDFPIHTSTNVGDRAVLEFNGTAISISGLVTTVSGSYNVSIDQESPLTLSAKSFLNSSSPTVLFFRTGLDPSAVHHLTVVNAGAMSDVNAGSLLALASAQITTVESSGVSPSSPPSAMSSSNLPRGTIAAIAVCATLAFVALLASLGIYIHRKRSAMRRKRGFIQNPRLGRLRRLSFMARGARSHNTDPEKDRQEFVPEGARRSDVAVLDIARKSVDGTDDEDLDDGNANSRVGRHEGRVASQNSDGSFAIDLPQQPDAGHVRSSFGDSQPQPHSEISTSPISPIVFRATRPRGPRDMQGTLTAHARDNSRGILLHDVGRSDGSGLPEVKAVSPFRVNFRDADVPQEEDSARRQERREERHVSTASSIPQSLKIMLFGHDRSPESTFPPPTVPPPIPTNEPRVSFLDMESSHSPSVKSFARQSSTGSSSRADNVSTDFASLPPPPDRKSFALSMNIGGGPTPSHPSLSPSISLQPIPLPLPPIPTERSTLAVPESSTLVPADGNAPTGSPIESELSPTDSLPLTVSDIHFRHSSYSSVSQPESRRVSGINRTSSQRHPHPPLPERPDSKPFIVQKILGMQGSNPASPYTSPTVPTFAEPGSSSGRNRSTQPSPMTPGFAFRSIIPHDSTGRTK